jgi:phosphohistidine phosphatase
MIIYFLRHASAGQSNKNNSQDAKRPLDKEGMEQCRYVGRVLAALNVQVDAMISSPLKRASQTASLVANEIGHDDKIELHPALQPEASFESFRELLQDHAKQDAIMVVGHNPNLSQFISLLISDGANENAVDLKKGAVAKVETTGRKPAVLNWCLVPKLVRAVYEATGTSSLPKTARK